MVDEIEREKSNKYSFMSKIMKLDVAERVQKSMRNVLANSLNIFRTFRMSRIYEDQHKA